MFIQPESWIEKQEDVKLKRCSKQQLKEIVAKEHNISAYSSTTRGQPESYTSLDPSSPPGDAEDMRRRMFIHTIVRCNDDGTDVTPEEQNIGAFSGFMSSISNKEERSKPYYFLTLPQGPTKKVVYTCMEKAIAAAEAKQMPFVQFVGDQPVYAFIVEVKNENWGCTKNQSWYWDFSKT